MNKEKVKKIIGIVLIALFITCISIFYRTIFQKVFIYYDNDGSVQGLEVIFYYLLIMPATVSIIIGYIIMLIKSNKIVYNIIITILLNYIMIYMHFINNCLMIYDIIFIIYIIIYNKTPKKEQSQRTLVILILSILLFLFFPVNPIIYEEYASNDVEVEIRRIPWVYSNYQGKNIHYIKNEHGIISYPYHVYKKEKGYIHYKLTRREEGENMKKEVIAFIENDEVTKATIKYKSLIYEYKNKKITKNYKTKIHQFINITLSKMYQNYFKEIRNI